jgi:hypothetical protein
LKADTGDGGRITPALPIFGAAGSSCSGNGIGLASATAVGLGLAAGAAGCACAAGRAAIAGALRKSGFAGCAVAVGAAEAVLALVSLSFELNRLPKNFFVAATPGTDEVL